MRDAFRSELISLITEEETKLHEVLEEALLVHHDNEVKQAELVRKAAGHKARKEAFELVRSMHYEHYGY